MKDCNYRYNGQSFDAEEIKIVNDLHNTVENKLRESLLAVTQVHEDNSKQYSKLDNSQSFQESQERLNAIQEIFNQNPELANTVYEALGFKTNITQDSKSYYRGQYDEPFIDSNGNLILKAREDSLYKKAGLKSFGVSLTRDMESAKEYGEGQNLVRYNLKEDELGYDRDSWEGETALSEITDNGYYLIQIDDNINNEIIKEAGEVKAINDVVVPKGKYKIEHFSETIEQITPQQKQQALQLYSQYLEQNPNGSVEQFKSWVEEFNNKSKVQGAYDFSATSNSGKWNSANNELLSLVQNNRKAFAIYKLLIGDVQTFKEIIDYLYEKGIEIPYTDRMKRADETMTVEEIQSAIDSYNNSVSEKIDNKNQVERDILSENNLQDETEYTPQELIEKYPLAGVQKVIWNLIKDIVNKLGIKVKFSSSRITEGFDGSNNPQNGEILIRPSTLKNGRFGEVLVHEVVHALTTKIISRVNSGVTTGLTQKQINAVKGLMKLFEAVKADNNLENKYPVKDVFEFIAHLTNETFVKELESKDRTFLQKVVDFILDILGINNANELSKKYLIDIISDGVFLEENGITVLPSDYGSKLQGSLSDFISQKSQENNSFKQFQQSLNKSNTNPILKGNQQEQLKKFQELQERLSNKEFLEGAKNAFESSEELQNVYYEALGFDNNLPLPVNKEIEFLLHTEKLKINLQDITLEEEGNVDLNSKDKWNTFAIKAKGKKLGYIQVKYKDDNTVKIGLSALYEGKEEVKQSIISKILDIIKNIFKSKKVEISDKKTNVNAGKGIGKISYELLAVKLKKEYQKELISDTTRSDYAENLWKSFEKQGKASVIGKTDTQYRWDYYYKFNVGNQVTLEQKQDALNAYTDYIARVSLGIVKNPSSGGYNYESQVKDIVYHGTNAEFENFSRDIEYFKLDKNINRPFYFTTSKTFWNRKNRKTAILNILSIVNRQTFENNSEFKELFNKIIKEEGSLHGITTYDKFLSEVDRKSPYPFENPKVGEYLRKNNLTFETPEGGQTYTVFEPEQIHVLGGKQDIEGFKNFVDNEQNSTQTEEQQQNILDNPAVLDVIENINNTLDANIVTINLFGEITVDVTPIIDKYLPDRVESRQLPNLDVSSNVDNIESQLALLQKAFPNISIEFDSTITSKGQVVKRNKKDVILINPNIFTEDTLIHEYGHIFIDLLISLGYSNIINKGIEQLKNTTLWKEVAAAYPEYTIDELGKEVLATAIGLEGSDEFANISNNQTILDKIRNIINNILETLRIKLGLQPNVAKMLAKKMLKGNLLSEASDIIIEKEYNSKKLTKEEMSAVLQEHTSRVDANKYTYYDKTINKTVKSQTSITKMISDGDAIANIEEHIRINVLVRLGLFDKDPATYTIEDVVNIDRAITEFRAQMDQQKYQGVKFHELAQDIVQKTIKTKTDSSGSVIQDVNYYFIDGSRYGQLSQDKKNTLFRQFVTKLETIQAEHPGATFFTEYAFFDSTLPLFLLGKIDLLIVNPDGTGSIYDFKISKNPTIDENGQLAKNYLMNVYVKHAKQLYGYSAIMSKLFNFDIIEHVIVPIYTELDETGEFKKAIFEPNINVNVIRDEAAYLKRQMYTKLGAYLQPLRVEEPLAEALSNIINKKIHATEQHVKQIISDKSTNIKPDKFNSILNDLRFYNGFKSIEINLIHIKDLIKDIRASLDAATTVTANVKATSGITIPISKKTLAELYNAITYLELVVGQVVDLNNLQTHNYSDSEDADITNIKNTLIKSTIDIKSDINITKEVLINAILSNLALSMVANTEIGMAAYREQYHKEFLEKANIEIKTIAGTINYYENGQSISKDRYNSLRTAFIKKMVELNADEIFDKRLEIAQRYIKTIPFDIPSAWRFYSASLLNNSILETINTQLRSLDTLKNIKFLDFQLRYKEAFDKTLSISEKIQLTTGLNPEKIFGKFIEGDHLVTKYSKEFLYGVGGFFELQSTINEIRKEIDLYQQQAAKEADTLEAAALQYKIETAEDKIKELNKEWFRNNTKKEFVDGKAVLFPADKWLNPRFNEIKDDGIYKLIVSMAAEADALLDNKQLKTGIQLFNAVFIKIPSREKGKFESLQSFDSLLRTVANNFRRTADSDEFGVDSLDTYTLDRLEQINLAAAERREKATQSGVSDTNISFPYRGLLSDNNDIEEHTRNLSKDLLTSFMANYYASLNFSLKTEIKEDIMLTLNVLGTSSNTETSFSQNHSGTISRVGGVHSESSSIFRKLADLDSLTIISEKNSTVEGGSSYKIQSNQETRWYKALESVVRQRLLGIKSVGKPSTHALAKILHTATVIHNLTFNSLAALANGVQIYLRTFLEAAKGNKISLKGIAGAIFNQIFRSLNVRDNMYDFFHTVPKSKIGVISKEMNAHKDGGIYSFNLYGHFLDDILSTKTSNFMNNIVEYLGSHFIVESYLRSIEVYNKNGEHIGNLYSNLTVDNHKVTNWDSLYTADGTLIDKGSIRETLLDLNTVINGLYDSEEVVDAKQTFWGKFLFLYKSWVPHTLTNQYRYFMLNNKDMFETEGSSEAYAKYMSTLDRYDVGYEAEFFKLLAVPMKEIINVFKHIRDIELKTLKDNFNIRKNTKEYYNSLNTDQKRAIQAANLYLMVYLVQNLISQMAAALLMLDLDDDEEEAILKYDIAEHKKKLENIKEEKIASSDIDAIKKRDDNIKELETIINSLETALHEKDYDKYMENKSIDENVYKYVGKTSPDRFKPFKGGYIARYMEVTPSDFQLYGIRLPGNKPIFKINNDASNWNKVFGLAVLAHRLESEATQFSLLSALPMPGRESPVKKIFKPLDSAYKMTNNPISGLTAISAITDLLKLTISSVSTTPKYKTNTLSNEFEKYDLYDNFKYQEKSFMDRYGNAVFSSYNRDYRKFWKIYNKIEQYDVK